MLRLTIVECAQLSALLPQTGKDPYRHLCAWFEVITRHAELAKLDHVEIYPGNDWYHELCSHCAEHGLGEVNR